MSHRIDRTIQPLEITPSAVGYVRQGGCAWLGIVDLANPTGCGARVQHLRFGRLCRVAQRRKAPALRRRPHIRTRRDRALHHWTREPCRLRLSWRPSIRCVEVRYPHKGRTARVLYVGPQVVDGQYVSAGDPIGLSQDLSILYPNGITNHVHVEIAGADGAHVETSDLLPAGVQAHATTS